ncbi:Vsb1 protein [Maudiozyma humilis]|uniref:Vsb1 protein n=1 Tax=Maudiozyma humilis TaxID=51915 RepID=A0AAV5RRX8_MAUHU|nr:Vsb1 protein [Kazachstania humilis]
MVIHISNKNTQLHRPSISESISVSLGLQNQDHLANGNSRQETEYTATELPLNHSVPPFLQNDGTFIGRSYINGFLAGSPGAKRPSRNNLNGEQYSRSMYSKPIYESQKLHNQTAEISRDFDRVSDDDKDIRNYIDSIEKENALTKRRHGEDGVVGNMEINENLINRDLENNTPTVTLSKVSDEEIDEYSRLFLSPVPSKSSQIQGVRSRTSYNSITQTEGSAPPVGLTGKITALSSDILHYLPAAVLGLLLNILDALSYGMIIFPITEPVFSQLGPTGLSMFYISTIISQFIYSSGWSSFPSGIGSEMIEITPFFHTMATAVMNALPGEGKDDEIITTTIFCYCISTIITGLTFLSLGKLRMGKIVGFFPRHILIGCIGGVGYFLLITGIEVSTRAAKFEYSLAFLGHLFSDPETLWKWLLPVILTIILVLTQKYFKNSLVLPSFYILTLCLFHFIVAIVPTLSLGHLRSNGWIFPISSSDSHWYDHYKLFDLTKVHWMLVLKQVPTMLALTFFGILHVPINVPALAMSLQMDKYDVDKELIAHGWSNLVSGAVGSIQNYLVYTNSVLFIRAGADSAMAGYILIVLTICVMAIGPVIISFIPICIVASLIFLLGYELLVEAVWDTFGKLTVFEYMTVIIIVLTMGVFDFVLGIIVGILIACFKFLVDSTKLQTINGEFDGTVARSTVARDEVQSNFLKGIGEQIYVLKLQNMLFFGTIISIEEKIDRLLEISDNDSSKRRIKYLILDFKNINADNIDYSAAEGFNRIKRFTQSKKIQLIISSIKAKDHIYQAFNNVGLLEGVELFNDLNSALEWCENEFLFKYKELRERAKARLQQRDSDAQMSLIAPASGKNRTHGSLTHSSIGQYNTPLPLNTPRNYQILHVAQDVFRTEQQTSHTLEQNLTDIPETEEPILTLLLSVLRQYRPSIISGSQEEREREIAFWSQLPPYLQRVELPAQSTMVHNDNVFFVVESGVLKVTFNLPQGVVYETVSTRTCYGKMVQKRDVARDGRVIGSDPLTIKVETDSVLYVVDSAALARMRTENVALFLELSLLVMTIKDTRFKELLGYALVSS